MPTTEVEIDPPIDEEPTVIVNPDRFAQRFSAAQLFEWPQVRPAARVVRASMCECCIFGRHELCSSELCTCVCRNLRRLRTEIDLGADLSN
jgi:hypothetical protein